MSFLYYGVNEHQKASVGTHNTWQISKSDYIVALREPALSALEQGFGIDVLVLLLLLICHKLCRVGPFLLAMVLLDPSAHVGEFEIAGVFDRL